MAEKPVMEAPSPKDNNGSVILLPSRVPSEIPSDFLTIAFNEIASSGKLVPNPIKRPITNEFIDMALAMKTADSTT